MRTRRVDDRGGSAVEAALLVAGIAVVMIPALFLLGRAVDSAFSQPCNELPNGSCADSSASGGGSNGGGSGGGGGGGGSPAQVATRDLEHWVAGQVRPNNSSGNTTVSCDDLETVTPPPGFTTTCVATFSNGDPDRQVVVEWDSDGNRQLKDA